MIEINIQKSLQAADGPMRLHIQLEIGQGDLVTLFGPSGAGKTSTLRILAGLMQADSGTISVNGESWFDSERSLNMPPRHREIGFVFQDYALFPNMNVIQNLQFAMGKMGDPSVLSRVMGITQLEGLKDRKTTELSGGQQQRVALARALVQRPKLLLLDEPLAALDKSIRLKLQDYLLELHEEFGLTTILISHDLGEIMKLSDQVFVLENGSIVKTGTPEEVFLPKRVSGKFQFTGEVVRIEQEDIVCIVTVRIQNSLIKVIAGPDESNSLMVGDPVVVASKAFNPIIYKLSE